MFYTFTIVNHQDFHFNYIDNKIDFSNFLDLETPNHVCPTRC